MLTVKSNLWIQARGGGDIAKQGPMQTGADWSVSSQPSHKT